VPLRSSLFSFPPNSEACQSTQRNSSRPIRIAAPDRSISSHRASIRTTSDFLTNWLVKYRKCPLGATQSPLRRVVKPPGPQLICRSPVTPSFSGLYSLISFFSSLPIIIGLWRILIPNRHPAPAKPDRRSRLAGNKSRSAVSLHHFFTHSGSAKDGTRPAIHGSLFSALQIHKKTK
jgi:hypothetical protein